MDVGTSLVQTYLRVNGYFTATEYPLIETVRDGSPRTVTDIDMLAVGALCTSLAARDGTRSRAGDP